MPRRALPARGVRADRLRQHRAAWTERLARRRHRLEKPFADIARDRFCEKNDARHVAVTLERTAGFSKPLTIHNFYVPAGGDEPDPEINVKFAHKLAFLDELRSCTASRAAKAGERALLVGDLNVAPLEHDVWSHKQLLDVVSHTPIEVEKLGRVQRAGGWLDVMRGFVPETEKLYTWWSYRAPDWKKAEQGPPPRPYLGEPGARGSGEEDVGRARDPRLAAAVRPRAGDRRVRSLGIRSSAYRDRRIRRLRIRSAAGARRSRRPTSASRSAI